MAHGLLETFTISSLAAGVRVLFSLPPPVRRALVGGPVVVDGTRLDLDMQLLLWLQRVTGRGLVTTTPERARREVEEGDRILRGRLVRPVASRDLDLPGGLSARLYTPVELAPRSGLLVYFHGGGWIVGSLDTHDNVCRFLAYHSGVRVMSLGYRLAPEHPYPAAADDAYAGFRYAVEQAGQWGVDPDAVAVGGDSAGGNLAIAAALQAVESPGPRPAYQLLIYPATDHTTRRASRGRYGRGFMLTDDTMTWYGDHYVGAADRSEPLLSPLVAPNLGDLPSAYVSVAGFDPLRDEGVAFAEKLAAAGVPVTLRVFDDLIHGYANFFGFSRRAHEAMADAALALHRAVGAASPEQPA